MDILRQCSTCSRPFIFFAREQNHWYETLGFYIDADCVNCHECRLSDQQLRRRFRRYSEAIGRVEFSERELETLLRDALFLWRAGILRDWQRIRSLRNMARRQIPDSTTLREMDELISGFTSDKNPV